MNAEIYRTISREYELQKYNSERKYNEELNELYNNNSELKSLNGEIASLGIQAAKLSLASKTENADKVSELLAKIEELKKKKDIIIQQNWNKAKPIYECEKCKDTGYITEGLTTRRCSCMEQKILNISYNNSNLNLLKDSTFDKFDLTLYSDKKNDSGGITARENSKKLLKLAHSFVENFESGEAKNLLFVGPSGTGKTFLSSCIANEIIKKGHTVLYQTAPLLLDKIFEYKYSDSIKSDKNLYDSVYNADLLIIDDLGTENPTPAKFAELFTIINARILEKNKKTIISSNFDLEKLGKLYDHRLISRFVGNFSICKFIGNDIRLTKSK